MLTLKEKVEVLKILEQVPFEESRIAELLEWSKENDLKKPILKRILEYLINLDCEISAFYETADDDLWETLNNDENIIGEHFELKEKITSFSKYFVMYSEALDENNISFVLDILSPLFKVKSRNLQFLLFIQAKKHPTQVFAYLISKMKKFPSVFVPFFCSLLVRLKTEESSLKSKCLSAYRKYILSLNPSNSISFLVVLQGLLYIHCFKEFSMTLEAEQLIKKCNDLNLLALLNKDVVLKYASMFEIKEPTFASFSNDCFYRFPFDQPIVTNIDNLVQDFFVTFDSPN